MLQSTIQAGKLFQKTLLGKLLKQITKRFEELIADAEVHLVSVNKDGKPTKIPEVLENNLKKYIF